MLLENKKSKSDEQNWCIVLNPIRNEIDKKKVSQKISEVFSLSSEEAMDLVSNTPIILLDNLSRPIAAQIKEFFLATGAEMVLTNDVFLKRKCYRTVWPEPPNLSFLHGWQKPEQPQDRQEMLTPDDALNEIRSLANDAFKDEFKKDEEPLKGFEEFKDEDDEHAPPLHEDLETDASDAPSESLPDLGTPFSFPTQEREQMLEEIERWREECLALREEASKIREELQKAKLNAFSPPLVKPETELSLAEKEKEVRELRTLLAHSEEKHAILKDESREARELFEEKLSLSARENEQLKIKINEMGEELEGLRGDKQAMTKAIDQRTLDFQNLKQEFKKSQEEMESRLSGALGQIEEWRAKSQQISGELVALERTKEAFQRTVNEQMRQLTHGKEKQDALMQKLEAVGLAQEQEKLLRVKAEERQKDLEKNQLRLIQELELRAEELRRAAEKFQEAEDEMARLRESHENQQKIIQDNMKQLEGRDRELESTRRQLREAHALIEQREVIHKKSQIAGFLAEKEAFLRGLVKEQERIETEMREREQTMRQIIEEQETVERDIIEAKQSQRHLLEQAKREQQKPVNPPPGRIKIHKAQDLAPGEDLPESSESPGS